MKKMLFLLVVLSLSAVARDNFADKIVCQQYNPETERILSGTLVISKTGPMLPGDYKIPELQFEATKTPASMSYYKNGLKPFSTERNFTGFVYEEDVSYLFKSSDNKTTFKLFMDEMEEGYLKLTRNSKTKYFFCN